MIDHYYVTHAQLLALRNVVAFIVQTMPEEQKESVLQVLKKFAEIALMNGIDSPPPSDIPPKTVEMLNKSY
ncbi:hypothetical protein C1459_15975, partial [Klebsiella pneumoniae]